MKKTPFLILIFSILTLYTSCKSTLAKLERSNDYNELYNGAIAFYERGKYEKAKILFERIYPYYRGAEEAEKIRYYWAYSEFYQGFYQLSSYQFKEFYQTFGRSPMAEEAQYMEAYSLYMDAPDADLDQGSSEQAVLAMQNFLNRYPASQYYQKANEIIDELQVRFETKAYSNAKLYYKLTTGLSYRTYLEAALVTFEAFKEDYPDSKYNEELLYLSVETSFKLADNSIVSKRKERFDQTIDLYKEFKEKYPESEYTTKVESYYELSIQELNKLKID